MGIFFFFYDAGYKSGWLAVAVGTFTVPLCAGAEGYPSPLSFIF